MAAGQAYVRIDDWKLVGDETWTQCRMHEIQQDWTAEHDLAAAMPEKTEETAYRSLEGN